MRLGPLLPLVALTFFSTGAAGARSAAQPLPSAVESASPAPAPSPGGAASTIERDGLTYAHRAVETADAEAQFDFDRGLTLLYAFNPQEARVAFEAAAARDPKLAMAQWGIALSHGPNINTDFSSPEQRAGRAAIEKARALEAAATAADRALIEAAAKRYASDRDRDDGALAAAYRDAMERAASDFASDDDVQVLAAEAALDVHPWEYFNDDGTPKPWTPAIVARLKTVLARDPSHIGANHYLIHSEEESHDLHSAEVAARFLFAQHFEYAAEHLTHMPAHIFMQIGDYHDAAVANERAVDAFAHYRADDDGTEKAHAGYFGHDCEFGIQAFDMAGERARASALAERCATPRFAAETDLRFGRFAEAHAADPTSDAVSALAAIASGDLATAQRCLQREDDPVMHEVVAGRLALRRGDTASAIASLRSAVKRQDALGYSEPPQFFYPVRETLGAVYLRAGDAVAAAKTFSDDLAKNPDNPRSLFGLTAALEREGKADEAKETRARFDRAWQHADVSLDLENL